MTRYVKPQKNAQLEMKNQYLEEERRLQLEHWGDIDEQAGVICIERNVTYTPESGRYC